MHLSTRQILLLILPFILSTIIYIYADDITTNIKYLFPAYSQYTNRDLNSKEKIYLKMEKKEKEYNEILNKIKLRKKNSSWIIKQVLYNKKKQQKIVKKENKKIKKSWKLQMVYPNKNIAIINGKIVKLNDIINNAKLIKIENSKVLLKQKENLQWVYLFQ